MVYNGTKYFCSENLNCIQFASLSFYIVGKYRNKLSIEIKTNTFIIISIILDAGTAELCGGNKNCEIQKDSEGTSIKKIL